MATFVREFAQRVSARGLDAAVVAYGQKNEIEEEGFPVHIVSRSGGRMLRYLRYFFALRKMAGKADLIYAQDLVSSGLPAALASKFLGTKLVLRLGGDFLWEQMIEKGKIFVSLKDYYDLPKSALERIYLSIYRFVLKRSSVVIFNNALSQSIYKTVFGNQIKFSIVVYNPEKRRVHRQSGKEGNIIYIGRFLKLKNLEMLIRAFSRISTQKKLILVGEGPEEEHLKKIADELHLNDRVLFVPTVSREKVLDMIAENYLLVLPSLADFNPNIVMEAFRGTAVLVTKETGLPAQIKSELKQFDPFNELELKEKIEELLNEKNYEEYRRRLSQIKFTLTWEDVIDQHLKVFEQIL